MNEKKVTGVRVYVLTVDSETNTVVKCEEEDPNTRDRTEVAQNFKVVPAQYPVPEITIPAGFVPSIVILVGGQVSSVSQSLEEGEHKKLFVTQPTVPTYHATLKTGPTTHHATARPKKAAEDKQADKGKPPKV